MSGVGIVFSVLLVGIAGLLGFTSVVATIASENIIKKTEKREKTVSLAEVKNCSISKHISKALQDASISDAEFASITSEVEQYYDLKAKLRQKNSRIALKKVDGTTLRDEIKKEFSSEKIRLSTRTRKELWIEFERKSNGFSLFIFLTYLF